MASDLDSNNFDGIVSFSRKTSMSEIDELRGKLAALREALQSVEFVTGDDDSEICPWCHQSSSFTGSQYSKRYKPAKHLDTCPRQLALTGARGAQLMVVLKAAREHIKAFDKWADTSDRPKNPQKDVDDWVRFLARREADLQIKNQREGEYFAAVRAAYLEDD